MTTPSVQTVIRVRYMAMVGIRGIAATLIAIGGAQLVRYLAEFAIIRFVGGMSFGVQEKVDLFRAVAIGPGVLLGTAFAMLRWGPALTRWMAPLPRKGCHECGYPVERARGGRCPECGTRIQEQPES